MFKKFIKRSKEIVKILFKKESEYACMDCFMKSRNDRSGIDVLNYILMFCEQNNLPINNIRIQKIMYYAQGEFIKNFDMKCFNDDILCWPYGPVVKSVWNKRHLDTSNDERVPYCECQDIFNKEEQKIINTIILSLIDKDIWELVEDVRSERPYILGTDRDSLKISDYDMMLHFCTKAECE